MDANIFLREDWSVEGRYWPKSDQNDRAYFSLHIREQKNGPELVMYVGFKEARAFADAIHQAFKEALTDE